METKFTIDNDVLTAYEGNAAKVEIPAGVREIAARVFAEHVELEEIVLPDGLEVIREEAFAFCGISTVTLPLSVKQIETDAFIWRKQGQYSWDTEDQYPVFKISKKHPCFHTDGKVLLRYLDDGTDALILCYKKGLLKYDIPQGVSVVCERAFVYCGKLNMVTIPEGVVSIEDDAFAGTKVGVLQLPDSVTAIGDNATRYYEAGKYGRQERVSVQVSDTHPCFFVENQYFMQRLENGETLLIAFQDTREKKAVIPANVNVIGKGAFWGTSVNQVQIPESVHTIGCNAFLRCDIKSIVIPEGVKRIEAGAFKCCQKLKTVELPASLEYLDADAFSKDAMPDIRIHKNNPHYAVVDGILYDKAITKVLCVFGNMEEKNCILPNTVTDIGTAFAGRSVKKLVLGKGITKIQTGAFVDSRIPVIEVLHDISEIETGAFSVKENGTYPVVTQIIGNAGTALCRYMDQQRKNKESLVYFLNREYYDEQIAKDWRYTVLDNEVTLYRYIGQATQVSVPAQIKGLPVTSLHQRVFANRSDIKEIILPESITAIGTCAFMGTGITSVRIPDGVVKLEGGVFANCAQLQTVEIPDSIVAIEESAFYDCMQLIKLVIPASVNVIDPHWLAAEQPWRKQGAWGEGSNRTPLTLCVTKDSYAHTFAEKYVTEIQKSENMYASRTIIISCGEQNDNCEQQVDDALIDAFFQYTTIGERDKFDLQDYYNEGDMKITGIKSPDGQGCVTIPEYIGGKPVVKLEVYSYYGNPIQKLTIPKTVVAISDMGSFPYVEGIIEIHMDNSVFSSEGTAILSKDGKRFFRLGSKKVTQYTVPNSVQIIEREAFKWCELKSIHLPDNVTTIKGNAFCFCDGVETVTGGAGITEYESTSFSNTKWYKNAQSVVLGATFIKGSEDDATVTIPEGVKSIGPNAFSGNQNLICVELPATLKTVGKGAFSRTKNLKKITLPEGLQTIAQEAFYNSSIEEIIIPATVKEIGKSAFCGCSNLKQIQIPAGVSGQYTDSFMHNDFAEHILSAKLFKDCVALSEVTIPEGVVRIGTGCFDGCESITHIALPDSIEELGDECFRGCVSMKSLYLPKKLHKIGTNAFPTIGRGWPVKKGVFAGVSVETGNEAFGEKGGMLYSADGKILITCPYSYPYEELIIPEGTEIIGENAFANNETLKKVTIPNYVISIGKNAFRNCKNLSEVVLPTSMERLEESVFENCTQLQTIHWPKMLKTIGAKCFRGASLETLTIPSSVENIENYAFARTHTKKVELPKTVRTIGISVFAGVPDITVYDNITPDAKPAESYEDDSNGMWNSRVGCIGIEQKESYVAGACNCDWYDHTISVKSADTGTLKFSVPMVGTTETRNIWCSLASSWGANAEFAFTHLDGDKFGKMKDMDNKLRIALLRLSQKYALSAEAEQMYGAWIKKNGAKLIGKLIAKGDLEQIITVSGYGAISKTNIGKMVDAANAANQIEIAAWLMDYQNRYFTKKK